MPYDTLAVLIEKKLYSRQFKCCLNTWFIDIFFCHNLRGAFLFCSLHLGQRNFSYEIFSIHGYTVYFKNVLYISTGKDVSVLKAKMTSASYLRGLHSTKKWIKTSTCMSWLGSGTYRAIKFSLLIHSKIKATVHASNTDQSHCHTDEFKDTWKNERDCFSSTCKHTIRSIQNRVENSKWK